MWRISSGVSDAPADLGGRRSILLAAASLGLYGDWEAERAGLLSRERAE